MSRHRYPASALRGDYARVAIGLAATLGPLLLIELATGMAIFLSGLALLFAWFGWRTWLRQRSCVELSSEAIALQGPFDRRLDWRALRHLKLAYFAPRRGRQGGWLQLTLAGDGIRAIRLDSTLEGFDQVLERAAREAAARALPLDAATAANLAALGVGTHGQRSPTQSVPPRADRSRLEPLGGPIDRVNLL